jgi:hypothetical protein
MDFIMKKLDLVCWIISMIIILLIIFANTVNADCYIVIDGSDKKEDMAFTRLVFNKYLEPVKEIPVEGIRSESCLYEIVVTYITTGVQLVINGPRNLNAEANDYKTALLKAVFDVSSVDLCKQYSDTIMDICDIGISVMFINSEGDLTYKPTGDFKIFITTKRRLYVYLINRDNKGKWRILFPSGGQHNPLVRNKTYIIPSIRSGESFYSDDLNNEQIDVLFSIQPIEDKELLFHPRKQKGVFVKRLL